MTMFPNAGMSPFNGMNSLGPLGGKSSTRCTVMTFV